MWSVRAPALVVPPAIRIRWFVLVHGAGLQERLPPTPIAVFALAAGAAIPGPPNDVEGNGLVPAPGCWTAVQPVPALVLNVYQVPAGSTTPPSTSGAAPPYMFTTPFHTAIEAPTRAAGFRAVLAVVEI